MFWLITVVREVYNNRKKYKSIKVLGTEECSICYEDLIIEVVELECKHIYHKVCIDKWLQDHTTCPLCRNDLIL